ncbi:MAG: thioredoxin domain-containing protein [Hyphomicrobiales bacterium]|nr:thioredoxin domain-containing protein [Hyphomicrobiales bacterium]
MKQSHIAIAAIGAIVIGAVGYLIGVEVTGRGPSAAVTEAAVKDYLEAHPELLAPEPVTVAGLSDEQREEVETTIRTHLIANPEIIRDAMEAFQHQQEEADRVAQVAAIANNKDLLFASERQVVLGNPEGSVTLVEFFDYNCGFCRRALEDMRELIAQDDNLRVVLKEFPVLGEGSVEAAQVSIAVNLVAPDQMNAFHDALLSQPGQVDGDVALAVAEDLGLDTGALREKLEADEVNDTITEVYALASELALTGTPSYVTANDVVIGAVGFDALKDRIASARESCGPETAIC